ncbi:alpha/beta hydrolase fold domain-containing protein [Microbacterium indicum]|uniref:alpha/beta hydrolase fold domain-containing protein n=1 Tax=Microbacterium indicum TaxID=358100 RepID=UPI0004122BCA|nr:alpha/beta hydrolase fold domain-containing protein [Microbacterium indicum]
MIVPDERLQLLIDAVAADAPPAPTAEPPFARRPGEARRAWLERLRAARAAADAEAIARRGVVDASAERLFGTSLAAALPDPRPLRRREFRVPVAGPGILDGISDELRGLAAAGAPSAAGADEDVRVSLTEPEDPSGSVVLRLHGGAFWMGGGDAADRVDAALIDHLASATGATVLNIDHRLAPEHPFPAPVLDVLCILRALRRGELDAEIGHAIDPSRIALVGTSSGSNIATVAAMADAATRPRHPIASLALIVPSVLLDDAPAGMRDDPAAWAARGRQLQAYLGDAIDASSRWASPARAQVLADMPPTFAAIARFDEIAMGGHRLVRAISAGGSEVGAREYAMTHAIALPEAEAAMLADVSAWVARAI